MGCGSCSSGACGSSGGTPAGCENNGNCSSGGCGKLDVFDWLAGMESSAVNSTPLVEVRFKNTRKEYYRYGTSITPSVGDIVMVEASHGTDVGAVTLTGELVRVQLTRKNPKTNINTLSRVIRIATQEDIDLWQEVQKKEDETMVKARKAAAELKLDMKISDVEYQGDGTKAIFYYTSESRVDFRELIKKFAGTFKVRVEMKQIGARQEAGRVGGIGSCGRELCCSTWLTDFRSVSTSAARYQQLAINPIKLAGQCGKLKCCLNYELDSYLDALKDFPEGDIKLKTKKGTAFLQKTDIFRKTLWFNTKEDPAVFHPLKLETVKEILEMNKQNKFPESLKQFAFVDAPVEDLPDYENVVGQDDLNRFNTKEKKKSNNRNRNKRKGKRPDSQGGGPKNDQRNQNQGPGGNQQGQKKNRPNQKRKPNGQNNPQNKKTGGNRPPKTNSKPKSE
ncbi:regulatory iron-sulfur-containing complex subunit RicT [bacterium]|nr:regulatory iron-sulfur-containing complex subunit RicT [bacterium]